MKRSEINRAIRRMEQELEKFKISIPPFCHWSPADWKEKGDDFDEIRDNMLGWDITDYGLGDFSKVGFTLITLRNGNVHMEKYAKPYAEKLLFLEEGQYAPLHFHWTKMEDIINKGGGTILIKVYGSAKDEELDLEHKVKVLKDGRQFYVEPGTQIELEPGESITVYPYLYHDFTVKEGTGSVILGEVSMCNDDVKDNRFYENMGRFPEIEEDEEIYRLLCNEYPKSR